MQFTVETEWETDGRWIAEVTELPGAMQYGRTRSEAIARAEALALRAIAERIEAGEQPVEPIHILLSEGQV
uniref:Predicted nuclease of the RNAse H fold, HicB family n=1 Tax=Candidatus Kentrum sp. FW TaxID=2126338 RepID=A0A450TTP2_9GAMM|nr:MAG: Predicted nuclease of the RNAse H fold, HicB family [Candidatus Kentron sp. FW]